MSDAVYIEMPPERKKSFFGKRGRIILIVFLLLVLLAAALSWWLSQGKVTSAAASLDTLVYTVTPQFSTQLKTLYARQGDIVEAGQPLASVDASVYNALSKKSEDELARLWQTPGMREIAERLSAAQRAEKDMAARVSQARMEEEKYRKVREERVTEHVRSQLAMRSLDRGNRAAYEHASQAEAAARGRMEAANADFEQVSRMRAAMDMELAKIRNEIIRTRKRANLETSAADNGAAPAANAEDNLYSPIAGRIIRINAAPGQTLIQGIPVFYILPTGRELSSDYWIQAWFPLADKDKIKVGQNVSIRFENNETTLTGKVADIPSGGEGAARLDANGAHANYLNAHEPPKYNADKYFPVSIAFDNPAEVEAMAPGTKVECQIQTRYLLGMEMLFK